MEGMESFQTQAGFLLLHMSPLSSIEMAAGDGLVLCGHMSGRVLVSCRKEMVDLKGL